MSFFTSKTTVKIKQTVSIGEGYRTFCSLHKLFNYIDYRLIEAQTMENLFQVGFEKVFFSGFNSKIYYNAVQNNVYYTYFLISSFRSR